MEKKTIDLALLKKAQQGHKESLSALAELARSDILAYLHRLTLDAHMAEDLCQETLMQMLKSLPTLRLPTVKTFWAWMYKTAFSKVSHQFRNQGNRRLQNQTTTDSRLLRQISAPDPSGSQALIHKELTTAIYEAMDSIKLGYRNILTLRCFQNLSYNEIALVTGGTELQARLLFFRAKRSLRHQLASRGFKKKTQLLPALTLFAALTSSQSKVATATLVKAATLNVSAGTMALGLATTKVGVAVIVIATACIIGGATSLDTFTAKSDVPMAAPIRLKNLDKTLLDRLRSSNFQRPVSIVKSNDLDGSGFPWADRSIKGPSIARADVPELLIRRPEQDRRTVILADGRWIVFHFQNPIIDGPGADIIIAGWSDPPPIIEVYDTQNNAFRLTNPTHLMDTWNRHLFGYDLAQMPNPIQPQIVRLIGTHNQGPHQGFELHEIRARLE